jgi:hypothetical protein
MGIAAARARASEYRSRANKGESPALSLEHDQKFFTSSRPTTKARMPTPRPGVAGPATVASVVSAVREARPKLCEQLRLPESRR